MDKKEYYNVNEISKYYQTTSRNVRRIIYNLKEDKNELLLRKNNNDNWEIHNLLLSKFKPQRKRKQKYYSLTIYPTDNYSSKVIKEMMRFICTNSSDSKLEVNYTIESSKNKVLHHHIHCYIKSDKKKELIKLIKESFYQLDYKEADIYDLEGWINYITKEGTQIIKLNKQTNEKF
jgi:hypothetical protein